MGFLNQMLDWLVSHKEAILSGIGIVWLVLSKAVSTEKSGPIITAMQAALDAIGKGLLLLGKLVSFLSEILNQLIKSDGVLGKK